MDEHRRMPTHSDGHPHALALTEALDAKENVLGAPYRRQSGGGQASWDDMRGVVRPVRAERHVWSGMCAGTACRRVRARDFVLGRMKSPSHLVVLTQYPCRHVSGRQSHTGELEAPARIFLERDAAWRCLVDRA
jgi:hypothetical protein